MVGCETMVTDMLTPYFGKQTEYYPGNLFSGIENKTIRRSEISICFHTYVLFSVT